MTITLTIPQDKEAELKAKAAAHGQDVADCVLSIALPETPQHISVVPQPYNAAAAIALLDAFATSDKYGTAEEQRETFAYLERVVDEDRPGQRSAFGKGYNPPANLDSWIEP